MNKMNPNEYLTSNFQYKEFFSGDIKLGLKSIEPPAELLNKIMLMAEELQLVRDYIESSIIILSGYRTPKWNTYCGGVKNSYHTQGIACDIRVNGMKPYDLAIYVSKLTEFKGYGVNIAKNFVHLDLRNKFTVFKY